MKLTISNKIQVRSAPLWEQMCFLSKPAKEDTRIELIDVLASELVKADAATASQVAKSHRLNNRETELLMELLQVNYILDVPDNEKCRL